MTTPNESGPPAPTPAAPQYPAPGTPGQPGAPGQYPQPPQYPQGPGAQYPQGPQPPQYPQGPQYGAPAPATSKAAAAGKIVLTRIVVAIVGIVVVSAIAYGWKVFKGEDPDLAKVGDCMAGTNADNLKVTKCTDAKAAYKVVGKVDDKTEADFNTDRKICAPFQGADSAFWKGEKGSTGYVLCLAPTK